MKKILILFLLIASVGVSYGAEFLVKAVDVTHKDPVKDRGCYKRGDVVVVFPDGHEWGKEERLPKFMVVKIPGLPVKDAKKYIESEWDNAIPKNPVLLTRRKYKIFVDDTPADIKDELNAKGEATTTWDAIKSYVKNKKTGETEARIIP